MKQGFFKYIIFYGIDFLKEYVFLVSRKKHSVVLFSSVSLVKVFLQHAATAFVQKVTNVVQRMVS